MLFFYLQIIYQHPLQSIERKKLELPRIYKNLPAAAVRWPMPVKRGVVGKY